MGLDGGPKQGARVSGRRKLEGAGGRLNNVGFLCEHSGVCGERDDGIG